MQSQVLLNQSHVLVIEVPLRACALSDNILTVEEVPLGACALSCALSDNILSVEGVPLGACCLSYKTTRTAPSTIESCNLKYY